MKSLLVLVALLLAGALVEQCFVPAPPVARRARETHRVTTERPRTVVKRVR